MDRRAFLGTMAGYGAGSLAASSPALFAREPALAAYFGLHPFLEAHPEAVFIRKTSVASKTDDAAKKQEGLALGKLILTLRDTPGVPLTHKFAIKPNLTATSKTGLTHAIVTDPFVVEGFVESMKQVGIPAEKIYVRDGLYRNQAGIGYLEMAERSGIHYHDDDSRDPTFQECTGGFVFKRAKYLGPFTYPDTYLINISKFKTHSMGLTLCVKNLQGTTIAPYIRFCSGIQADIRDDLQPDAGRHMDELFAKHQQAGIPRWDLAKAKSMETWAHRTIDSYKVLQPTLGLNVIEGVYGQNGNAFNSGPGPGGKPEIFLTNMLIFGKDAFRVDIIGHYLAGHEPGNFGLFHIGKDRGVSTALNPKNIPLYLWEDSGPKLAPLDQFPRTRLASPYLTRPGEAEYHICDEPFTYPPESVAANHSGDGRPSMRLLGESRSVDRADSRLVFEFYLPQDGFASVGLYDAAGTRVGVLEEGWLMRGLHATEWAPNLAPPGTYACRLRADGVDVSGRVRVTG